MTTYESTNPIKISYASNVWTLDSYTGAVPPGLVNNDEVTLSVSGTISATIRLYGSYVIGPDGWSQSTTSPSYWWTVLSDGFNDMPTFETNDPSGVGGCVPLKITVKVTRTPGDG